MSKKRTGCWLATLLLLVGLAGGAYLYFNYLHHAAQAHRHVPAGTTMALRVDGTKLLMFKPVRDHLWPVLLENRDQKANIDPRLKRIEEKTGISIPSDLRDMLIVSVDGGAWAILVGGTLEPGRFVNGLHEVLKEEGVGGWALEDELLIHQFGVTIGQADDGTVVFGTNRDIVQAALPPSDGDSALPLPVEGAVSFLVKQRAWNGMLNMLPLSLPGTDALSAVEQVTGHFALTEKPQLELLLWPKKTHEPQALAREVESFLSKIRLVLLVTPSDLAGGKRALQDAQVTATAKQVQVVAPWPYSVLDRAVKNLAEVIRAGKRLDPKGAPPSKKLQTSPLWPF